MNNQESKAHMKRTLVSITLLLHCAIGLLCERPQAQQPFSIITGLVAYYPFDGTAKDVSGNGNDGFDVGVVPCTDRHGRLQQAYAFDGRSSVVRVDRRVLDLGADEYSYTLWFSPYSLDQTENKTNPSGGSVLLNNKSGVGVGVAFSPLSKPNRLNYTIGGVTWDLAPFSNPDGFVEFQTNKWHAAVLVKKGVQYSFFIDGRLQDRRTNASATAYSLKDGVLIGSSFWNEYFFGAIDDVRLYSRALSDAEVLALYQYEVTLPEIHPATATAQVINGFVVGATITDAGYGYTNAPKVTIMGGGGSGASAVATIDAQGVVNSIKLVASGSGYTGTPSILIEDPPFPPTQAKGTANLVNGFITGVTLSEQGHGYGLTAPPVTFLGGGGSGAEGVAVVENGKVTRVVMTATGSGYTSVPKVLIAVPPGYPSLSIRVNQVTVNLNVLVGYRYKLQTSTTSGGTWSDVGSTFLATESTYSQVVDVKDHMQLFRIVQGP